MHSLWDEDQWPRYAKSEKQAEVRCSKQNEHKLVKVTKNSSSFFFFFFFEHTLVTLHLFFFFFFFLNIH